MIQRATSNLIRLLKIGRYGIMPEVCRLGDCCNVFTVIRHDVLPRLLRCERHHLELLFVGEQLLYKRLARSHLIAIVETRILLTIVLLDAADRIVEAAQASISKTKPLIFLHFVELATSAPLNHALV